MARLITEQDTNDNISTVSPIPLTCVATGFVQLTVYLPTRLPLTAFRRKSLGLYVAVWNWTQSCQDRFEKENYVELDDGTKGDFDDSDETSVLGIDHENICNW